MRLKAPFLHFFIQCTVGSQTCIIYFTYLTSKSAADVAKVAGKVPANPENDTNKHFPTLSSSWESSLIFIF